MKRKRDKEQDIADEPIVEDKGTIRFISEKRKKLSALFVQNGNRFDDRTVFDFIDLELKNRESIGQLLTQDYLGGKIDRETCIARLQENGFDKWWGRESLWYLIRVEKYSVTETVQDISNLIAECTMEYVSNRVIMQHKKQRTRKATIAFSYDGNFDVSEFCFQWNDRPA